MLYTSRFQSDHQRLGQRFRKNLYFLIFVLPFLPWIATHFFESQYRSYPLVKAFDSPVIESKNVFLENREELQNKLRLQLVFSLDLMVRAQQALWKENLSYTNAIGRVPDVFGVLSDLYRIRIPVANSKKLILEAKAERSSFFKEENSLILADRVLIDQNFNIQSNFKLPIPPKEYLGILAQTVLNRIYRNQFAIPSRSELDLMEGVYKNYFRYEIRTLSPTKTAEENVFGGRTLIAVGIKEPIKDEIIELMPLIEGSPTAHSSNNLFEWVFQNRQMVLLEEIAKANLEKIYFAQKIFFAHTGAYSSNFKTLLPHWLGLGNLESNFSLFHVEEFGLDPTFGYFAELACRDDPKVEVHAKISSLYRDKIWSINGYGQTGVLSEEVRVIDQLEKAKKMMDKMDRSVAGVPGAKTKANIPLLIDQVPDSASEFSEEGIGTPKNVQ